MAPILGDLDLLTYHQRVTVPLDVAVLLTVAFVWLASSTVLFVNGDHGDLRFNTQVPFIIRYIVCFVVYLLLPPIKGLAFFYYKIIAVLPSKDSAPPPHLLPIHDRASYYEQYPIHVTTKQSNVKPQNTEAEPEANERTALLGSNKAKERNRDEIVKDMHMVHQPEIQAIFVTKQRQNRPKLQTVEEMVKEQKMFRVKKMVELMPTWKGSGGKKEMWEGYYSWMDVLEVIDEVDEEDMEADVLVN
ncbi:hypothetical protein QBC44DRAFT_310593 [Cladorrhinum sp. PSN332]|nr:hypothetical protein QBC44DRAFT_310593 [Cladorrhinum sp. PSN332]